MLLQVDFVLRMIAEQKCLRSARILQEGEHLVSRRAFPSLYAGSYDQGEADFVRYIHEVFPKLFTIGDHELRGRLRRFMQLVLRNGRVHNEDFLHRFLFEFWADVCGSSGTQFTLGEKYFKGQNASGETAFTKNVVKRVYRGAENIPDIMAFSGASDRIVYIIEIKNEVLDDRALGQILRYYQVTRSICDRIATHWYVSKVVPVLVVPDGNRSFWDSLPFHFREVIEIVYWKSAADGSVELHDGKRALREMVCHALFTTP